MTTLGPLGGLPEGKEHLGYVRTPNRRRRYKRQAAAQSLLAAVDRVVRGAIPHLPKDADPEDFAQDIRELALKHPSMARSVWALAVHRWVLNWCRGFTRHAKEDAREPDSFDELPEQWQDFPYAVGPSRDTEDVVADKALAHRLARDFPEAVSQILDGKPVPDEVRHAALGLADRLPQPPLVAVIPKRPHSRAYGRAARCGRCGQPIGSVCTCPKRTKAEIRAALLTPHSPG